jgi:hypothetical protein
MESRITEEQVARNIVGRKGLNTEEQVRVMDRVAEV